MVGPFGETLVVDWGLARSFEEITPDAPPQAPASGYTVVAEVTAVQSGTEGTYAGQVMGIPAYMSPEQARGDRRTLGPAWDIYSLGATLYHLLTGCPPFTGKSMRDVLADVQAGNFSPPRSLAPWVPKPLDAVVRKAMALKSAERYESAVALAMDIDRYLADEPVQAYAETAGERVRRWARQNRGWVRAGLAALLFSLLVLAGGLVWANWAREEAVEAERLKAAALKREEKSNAQLREAKRKTREALDTTTDEVMGRLLGKQAEIGPEEKGFLKRLADAYRSLAKDPEDRALAADANLRIGRIHERLGTRPRLAPSSVPPPTDSAR